MLQYFHYQDHYVAETGQCSYENMRENWRLKFRAQTLVVVTSGRGTLLFKESKIIYAEASTKKFLL